MSAYGEVNNFQQNVLSVGKQFNPDDYEKVPIDQFLPEVVDKPKPQKWEVIGEAFAKAYYETFDSNRQNTVNFYHNEALMTYQNAKVMGKNNILQKLASLGFSAIKHKIVYQDFQPDPRTVKTNNMEIYIVISGVLLIKEEKQQFSFTDFFHLVPDGKSSYYIMNHIFQLVHTG